MTKNKKQKKSKTVIDINLDNSDVEIIARDKLRNVPSDYVSPESVGETEIKLKGTSGAKAKVVARDDIIFSSNNFQKGLDSLEKILLAEVGNKHKEKIAKIMNGLREEKKKKKPNLKKVTDLIISLKNIIALVAIQPDNLENIKRMIDTVSKNGFGI